MLSTDRVYEVVQGCECQIKRVECLPHRLELVFRHNRKEMYIDFELDEKNNRIFYSEGLFDTSLLPKDVSEYYFQLRQKILTTLQNQLESSETWRMRFLLGTFTWCHMPF